MTNEVLSAARKAAEDGVELESGPVDFNAESLRISDLELLSKQARTQSGKQATAKDEARALQPLKDMTGVVQRGVDSELAQVTKRMQEADSGAMEV